MSAVSDARTVTSAQVRKSIMHAFKKKRPMFLWGPPGIGKSEVVAATASLQEALAQRESQRASITKLESELVSKSALPISFHQAHYAELCARTAILCVAGCRSGCC